MKHGIAHQFWLAGILLLSGMGVLIYLISARTTVNENVEVTELLEGGERFRDRRVQVAGVVVAGTEEYDADTIDLRFRMTDEQGSEVAVRSRQPRPDAFEEGGVVIVTGRYDPKVGRLDAEDLKAKCPSRYEEDPDYQKLQAKANEETRGGGAPASDAATGLP